ncbi:hypothetical protein KKA85_00685, partial [bacterium]|nr:hypothetical protein [bacterium]
MFYHTSSAETRAGAHLGGYYWIPALIVLVALVASGGAPALAQTPQEGPGGPILLITNYDLPLSYYYAEILRTEGFNEFEVIDVRDVHICTMDPYDLVIIAEMHLNSLYPPKFQQYLDQGGNVIAFRPDPLLYGICGVASAADTLSNGYLLIDDGAAPGRGLV